MAMVEAPFLPIIYVRGYAGTDSEVEDTVSDPYMGFNLGSTRIRTVWTGATEKLYFESPLVRMMKDHGYRDVYSAGINLADIDEVQPGELRPRSIIIYRYYDQVSSVFGDGKQATMEHFGQGLNDLIVKVRDRICITKQEKDEFKVYLVGHSMGGLVIRCFLQNDKIGDTAVKEMVDKVFTYATPHNGIELDIVGNVPAFFNTHSVTNFNRKRMCEYLGLKNGTEPVNTLNDKFSPDRFFCLVGTNSKDYTAAAGWSARVVGPFSDGLVRINNAVVWGPNKDKKDGPTRLAPRAYVYRSHSGYYGIVNSEEGYQNLIRFLFGDARVDGRLEVEDISLPDDLEEMRKNGKEVRASYHFEAIASVRAAHWDLSRRVAAENSAVFRTYGELFPKKAVKNVDRKDRDDPELFTTFLSSAQRKDADRPSLGFAVEIGVLVPEYTVDGVLFLNNHYPGGYIFRDKLNLEATPPKPGEIGSAWQLMCGFDRNTPNKATEPVAPTDFEDRIEFRIPIVRENRPGIKATLVLTARYWNTPNARKPKRPPPRRPAS